MNNYTINVSINSKEQLKLSRRFFRRNGLSFNSKEIYFEGIVPAWRLDKVIEFSKKNNLSYKIINDFSERSTSYRYEFFKNNKPNIAGRYICVYCGRLMTPKKTTVDHYYPIGAASQSIKLQKKLRRKGLENINDLNNLVPACEKCNKRKGKKMGWWLFKGKIGQLTWLWYLRYAIKIGLFIYVATVVYDLTKGGL